MVVIDVSDVELLRIIEDSAVEGCVAWSAWPGLEVHMEGNLVWILTDVPFPMFNAVLKAQLPEGKVARKIEAVMASAREKKVPLCWFVTPQTRPVDLGRHLEARAFFLAGTSAEMVAHLERVIEPSRPEDLEVVEVLDAVDFERWVDVMASVFEFPDFAARAWFEIHASMGFGSDKPWRHYLALLEKEPVATSSVFFGRGAAALASVATVPEARGREIGSAVTVEALREARRKGYGLAVLFASEAGERLYRRLGFQKVCDTGMYIWSDD